MQNNLDVTQEHRYSLTGEELLTTRFENSMYISIAKGHHSIQFFSINIHGFNLTLRDPTKFSSH